MAASERLQVILELVSGQYKREAKAAATATGTIGDSAACAGTATGTLTKNWGGFIKIAAAAGLGILVREGLQLRKTLEDLGTQVEAWNRRAETVFGNQIDLAREWADANNEAFGMGKQALLGMLAATGDLLVPMGFARDVALDLSKKLLLAANAGNEWSAGAVSVESATERIRKAMLGEREGLIELGVKISAADLKQRLFEKGKANLTGEALKQAEAEETLNLVYERSADALTAAEEGTAGLMDARKELDAVKADAMETLAEETLPLQIAGYRGLAAVIARAKTVFAQFDGDLSSAEKNALVFADGLAQTEILSGEALTGVARFSAGVADAAVQTRRDTEAIILFAQSLELSGDEYAALAMMLKDSPELFGLAADQADQMGGAVLQMAQNAYSAARAAADLKAGIGDASELERLGEVAEETGDELGDTGDEIVYLTTSWESAADAILAANARLATSADPLEDFIGRFQRYQDMLADAGDPSGPGGAAITANEKLELGFEKLRLEAARLSPDQFEAAMGAMAEALGVTADEAERLLEEAGLLDGLVVDVTLRTNYVTAGTPPSLSTGGGFLEGTGLAHGGNAMANSIYQVGEGNKPEVFMIPGDSGRMFSNADALSIARAFSGGGKGGDLTINMGSVEPTVDAQRVAAMAAVVRRMET